MIAAFALLALPPGKLPCAPAVGISVGGAVFLAVGLADARSHFGFFLAVSAKLLRVGILLRPLGIGAADLGQKRARRAAGNGGC